MSTAFDARLGPAAVVPVKPHLDHPMDIRLALGILAVLAGGLFYMAYSIRSDIAESGGGPTTILPFVLLGACPSSVRCCGDLEDIGVSGRGIWPVWAV
jgi:hypothetical protein